MNILFVTEDHSTNNYGITSIVSQLADEIITHDKDVQIIIATTGLNPVSQHKTIPIEVMHPKGEGNAWGWSSNLKERLGDIVTHYHVDVIHIHGVWMAVQLVALSIAKQKAIPCLVSAHGMLEPWLWNQQSLIKKLKKKIYFHLLLQNKITKNTFFHAITPIEDEHLKHLFPGRPVSVIPNAIKLGETNFSNCSDPSRLEKKIVFLGRLHPVKGLDVLIRAFSKAGLDDDWRLVIAGPAYVPQYVDKLKSIVSELNLSDQVEFIGPIYGDAKLTLMQKAWTVIVPSYSEVVGMVNLEAAACKTPSITTFETGLWDWEEGGGVLVHPEVDELCDAILNASRWSDEERILRGEKSYILVREKYSWNAVISNWVKLYSNVYMRRGRNG